MVFWRVKGLKKIVDTPKSYSKQTFSNTGVVFNEYDFEYGTILNRRQTYSKQAFSNTGVVFNKYDFWIQ